MPSVRGLTEPRRRSIDNARFSRRWGSPYNCPARADEPYNRWLLAFAVALGIALRYVPRLSRALIATFGATRVSEPEVKFLFLVLFVLGGLATTARSEAVLPAYLVGLVVAGGFVEARVL